MQFSGRIDDCKQRASAGISDRRSSCPDRWTSAGAESQTEDEKLSAWTPSSPFPTHSNSRSIMLQASGNALRLVKNGMFLGHCAFYATQEGLAVLRCGTRASDRGGLEPKADAPSPAEAGRHHRSKGVLSRLNEPRPVLCYRDELTKDGMVIDL